MPEYQPPPLPDAGPPAPRPLPSDAGSPGMAPIPEQPMPKSRRIGPAAVAVVLIALGAIGATLVVRLGTGKDGGKLEPGWRRVKVAAEGFSVGLPPGWRSVSTTDADKAYEALKSANPQLASLVKDQLGGTLSSLIKLLAFDTRSPTLAQQFATNMNVVVAPAAGVDIDTFVEQNLAQLRKTPGLTNVESSKIELATGRAGLVTSQLTVNAPGGAQQVAITQYLVTNGEKGYIMSFSTLPSFVASYKGQFQKIAETLRLE
jgi:hypothetical protein